ncbi:hypothetical protein [Patulibacter sp.]|uniref:hypothetical protein n=1 Tax=Patulibacter sp. TaxID=1912859 RepID=UPI00271AD8E8|nr:hypothetical protein [Patulibacter sp.]MDO9410397.1 hypothetical protein [Patulibacter sp.]
MRRPLLALLLLAALLAGGLAPSPARAAKQWDQAGLWDFVDRRQAQIEPRWQAGRSTYLPVGNDDDVRLDANMLAVHAAAARSRHKGASRHDDRVVALADVLTRAPAFLTPPESRNGGQAHIPGWSSSTSSPGAQHVAIDPQVASALASAWEVRKAVGMPDDVADRIVERIRSVADSGFYRYPAMLLNQFNWQGDMAMAAYKVSGDPQYLEQYRLQLMRFVQGTRAPLTEGRTAFLNGGLGLIYSPRAAGSLGPALLSSSEYENLIYSGLRHYDLAVAAGMAPLSPDDEARLKLWGQRTLYGDWTHAGTLNWDTSLGTRRWHLTRYWAFALQGVETLATNTRLTGSAPEAAWATWIAQRALETYDIYAGRQRTGLLETGLWGVVGRDASAEADPIFTAARFASHAARLAQLGFGSRKDVLPPGWFAWDPDAGRLAVSTKRYSTGLLLRHPTDDIGGIEMSRLFGAAGDPVSGTGGSARSAFGLDLTVRGRVVLDSEPGRNLRQAGTQQLRVTLGGGLPLRGTFTEGLRAYGTSKGSAGTIRVDQRFDQDGVDVLRSVKSIEDADATVRLPAWGSAARVSAVMADGTTVRLASKPIPAKGVRGLLVDARRGGYRVGLCRLPADARLRLASVAPLSTSTSTRRVAQVLFPVPAGASRRIDVRLAPTIARPLAEKLCG